MAPALISLDITPKTPADQQKLARALQVLAAEDAELRVTPGANVLQAEVLEEILAHQLLERRQ